MLAYDQATDVAQPVTAAPVSPVLAGGFRILDLVKVLWRRKLAIIALALLCAVAALVIGKSLTPRYVATAQLYVDPRELLLLDRDVTPRSPDGGGLPMIVDSQARVITSSSVLLRAVESTKLQDDPEFAGSATGGFNLLAMLGLGGKPTAEQAQAARYAALDTLGRHITVRRTDKTFIIEIEVWSKDAAKAATLANAVAKAYLSESIQSQATSARRATQDISGRLKLLQERLRDAENRLADYKAKNNIIGGGDGLVTDQQLTDINQRLVAARTATLDAQARYDQIESSRRSSDDGGAVVEALRSPTLASLRAQYAEARRRQTELANDLGPRHPAYKNLEIQVQDIQRNINAEIVRYAQSAKNDLTRARDYEAGLNRTLDTLKAQSVTLSQAAVRMRELERDVAASRGVYEASLKRSRETEEQESLNTSNARVISDAIAPQRRSFPPGMSLLMMLGGIFGALAASVIVLAIDIFSGAPSVKPVPRPQPPAPSSPPPPPAAAMRSPSLVPQPADAMPAPVTLIDKPQLARLQASDVSILPVTAIDAAGEPDLTRLGWPTLRAGIPLTPFVNMMRRLRNTSATRCGAGRSPVISVIDNFDGENRSIVALNVALAAARDGVEVLLVDAGVTHRALSQRLGAPAPPARSGSVLTKGLLSKGLRLAEGLLKGKQVTSVKTKNGVTVLRFEQEFPVKPAIEAMRDAVAQARTSGQFGLIVLDGPAVPLRSADPTLLDLADNLFAVLPATTDINDRMEDILSSLQGIEHKLLGVILDELTDLKAHDAEIRAYA